MSTGYFLRQLQYSTEQNAFSSSYFMKQKCQLQTGIAHCKYAATPSRTRGINTTYIYITLIYLKGLQKLLVKVEI